MSAVVIGSFAAIGALTAGVIYAWLDINTLSPLVAALLGGLFGASLAIKALQSE